jgi:hypothetical protein
MGISPFNYFLGVVMVWIKKKLKEINNLRLSPFLPKTKTLFEQLCL